MRKVTKKSNQNLSPLQQQWKEMIEDPGQKIGRPRQLYTGYAKRDYQDIKGR